MVRNEVSLLARLRRPDQVGTMNIRYRSLLVLLASLFLMQPGLWVLTHYDLPVWACVLTWASFWMGGQLFVLAMIDEKNDEM